MFISKFSEWGKGLSTFDHGLSIRSLALNQYDIEKVEIKCALVSLVKGPKQFYFPKPAE